MQKYNQFNQKKIKEKFQDKSIAEIYAKLHKEQQNEPSLEVGDIVLWKYIEEDDDYHQSTIGIGRYEGRKNVIVSIYNLSAGLPKMHTIKVYLSDIVLLQKANDTHGIDPDYLFTEY